MTMQRLGSTIDLAKQEMVTKVALAANFWVQEGTNKDNIDAAR